MSKKDNVDYRSFRYKMQQFCADPISVLNPSKGKERRKRGREEIIKKKGEMTGKKDEGVDM